MEMELTLGQEEATTKDHLLKTYDMDSDRCTGTMILITKETGVKEFKVVLDKFGKRANLFRKAFFSVANLLHKIHKNIVSINLLLSIIIKNSILKEQASPLNNSNFPISNRDRKKDLILSTQEMIFTLDRM